MTKLAAGLLAVIALGLVGFGIERIVYWASQPVGPQLGAGEMFGIVMGAVLAGLGVAVSLTARGVWNDRRSAWMVAALWGGLLSFVGYVVLTTPGPPPLTPVMSVGAIALGLTLIGLAVARWISWRMERSR